jgi:hypothetical protein
MNIFFRGLASFIKVGHQLSQILLLHEVFLGNEQA